jgi:excisionase family DNA binding protein
VRFGAALERVPPASVPRGSPVTLEQLHEQVRALTAAVSALMGQTAAHQPLVDLRAAAEHLNVSTRTLRRMVEREEVPFRRIGRTLRFNLALLAPRT